MGDSEQGRGVWKPDIGDRWREIQGNNNWTGLLHEPSFDPVLKSEILKYGDFVSACYRALENDRILSDKLLLQESENLRDCGYEIRHYIYGNVRSSTVACIPRDMKSEGTVWIGFIAVCTDEDERRRLGRRDIVVAFRGAQTQGEWIHRHNDILVPWEDSVDQNVKIQKDVWDFYNDLPGAREIITGRIRNLVDEHANEEFSITLTGHSLGGALATMSACDIKLQQPQLQVTVFAFAPPRIGNQAFADHVTSIGVKVLRVKVRSAWIPKVRRLASNREKITRKILRKKSLCHVGIRFRLDYPHSILISRRRDRQLHGQGLNTFLYLLYIIDGYQGSVRLFQPSERGNNYFNAVESTSSSCWVLLSPICSKALLTSGLSPHDQLALAQSNNDAHQVHRNNPAIRIKNYLHITF